MYGGGLLPPLTIIHVFAAIPKPPPVQWEAGRLREQMHLKLLAADVVILKI